MSSPEYLRLLEVFSRADGDKTAPVMFTVLRLETPNPRVYDLVVIDDLGRELEKYIPPKNEWGVRNLDSDYCIDLGAITHLTMKVAGKFIFADRSHKHYRNRPLALCQLKLMPCGA